MGELAVQGRGHCSVKPDRVEISFDLSSEEWSYEESLNDLGRQTEELRAVLQEAGIEGSDLKTKDFSVDILYREEKRKDGDREIRERIFSGYRADHSLQIALDMDKEYLNTVLNHIASLHSGSRFSLSFSVRDRESLRKRALAEAVKTAMDNAKTIADAAGIRLGGIKNIQYGTKEVHVYHENRYSDLMISEDAVNYDIEPQNLQHSDVVDMVFEISE